MRNFLEEADKKHVQDQRVRGWVKEIKELAFKTEDVIEIFALQVATSSGFKETLRRSVRIPCQLTSRHNVSVEINDIKAKLASIHQSLATSGITKGLEEGQTSNSQVNQRISFPYEVEKDNFIGMEKEIEQLLTNLKKEDKGIQVVSIWGMGGQGKTTLAQRIYNHDDIRDHFRAFAWVCISQQFNRENVLKEILKQLLPDDRAGVHSNMGVMELVDELRKVQQEKKCLVVIDDIWTIDSWRLLEPAFPLEKTTSGSKILLTTRRLTVAEIGSVCKISGLTEDEGWKLLSKKARIYDQPDIRMAQEMEKIGRKMVNKYEGLPLAISTLGGILKGKHLLREWEKINTDITFYLAKGEGVSNDDEYHTVRRVLGLSYDNLPSRLRHCFLCFANYKEDEIIRTEELYLFWMAEGLISMEDKAQGEMMFDVAERYLDELGNRSLVNVKTLDAGGDSWSKYEECGVHDLIHDLCLSKVKEEGVINIIDLERKRDDEFKGSIERRLCVRSYHGKKDVFEPNEQREISHIRSLFIWNEFGKSVVLPDKIFRLEKYKLLRVLTARGYRFSEQHIRSISELVYLKYLCLQDCEVFDLPTSIGKLRNLESLDLRTNGEIGSIPNVLWKLKMLKHLYLPGGYEVRGRGKKLRLKGLNELEVLHGFDSEYCDAHDLLQLPNLKVFLGDITVEENITSKDIAELAKSRELRHAYIEVKGREVRLLLLLECCFIDTLHIGIDRDIDTPMYVFPKADSYNGSYSGRLTELRLSGFRMEEDPMILLQKLPNLRHLSLRASEYLGEGEIVCSAKSFLELQDLVLTQFKGLRGWRVEEGAMPNLSYLSIQECSNLEMLPIGLTRLTSLNTLYIRSMPSTFTDKIKVIDDVEGQDFYKVRHISNLNLD